MHFMVWAQEEVSRIHGWYEYKTAIKLLGPWMWPIERHGGPPTWLTLLLQLREWETSWQIQTIFFFPKWRQSASKDWETILSHVGGNSGGLSLQSVNQLFYATKTFTFFKMSVHGMNKHPSCLLAEITKRTKNIPVHHSIRICCCKHLSWERRDKKGDIWARLVDTRKMASPSKGSLLHPPSFGNILL